MEGLNWLPTAITALISIVGGYGVVNVWLGKMKKYIPLVKKVLRVGTEGVEFLEAVAKAAEDKIFTDDEKALITAQAMQTLEAIFDHNEI